MREVAQKVELQPPKFEEVKQEAIPVPVKQQEKEKEVEIKQVEDKKKVSFNQEVSLFLNVESIMIM